VRDLFADAIECADRHVASGMQEEAAEGVGSIVCG